MESLFSLSIYFLVIVFMTGVLKQTSNEYLINEYNVPIRQYTKTREKYKRLALILFSVFLPVVIYALGDSVGIDRIAYLKYYDNAESLGYYMETGFNVIMVVCIFFKFDFIMFCAVCATIVFACVIGAIKLLKCERYYWVGAYVSLFLIYFVFFNAMRQILAVAIILLALSNLIAKRPFAAIAYFIMATFIHKTAVVCVVYLTMYLIITKVFTFKVLKKYNWIYFIIAVLLSILIMGSASLMLKVVQYFGFFKTYKIEVNWKALAFLLYFIPKLIVVLCFIKKDDKLTHTLILLWITFIPLQSMGVIIQYADRLSLYPSVIEIILIVRILKTLEGEQKKKDIFIILVLLYYIAYFFVMFYISNGNGIFPYKFYKLF